MKKLLLAFICVTLVIAGIAVGCTIAFVATRAPGAAFPFVLLFVDRLVALALGTACIAFLVYLLADS